MNIEKMRHEFEAWCGLRAMMKAKNPDDSYVYERTQIQWEAWQASRAAIEVELRPSLADDLTMKPSNPSA